MPWSARIFHDSELPGRHGGCRDGGRRYGGLHHGGEASAECAVDGFKHAPGESGLIATGKISGEFPETKILILTMYDDDDYLFHVLKTGLQVMCSKMRRMMN